MASEELSTAQTWTPLQSQASFLEGVPKTNPLVFQVERSLIPARGQTGGVGEPTFRKCRKLQKTLPLTVYTPPNNGQERLSLFLDDKNNPQCFSYQECFAAGWGRDRRDMMCRS
eukprot:EG_transcript_14941